MRRIKVKVSLETKVYFWISDTEGTEGTEGPFLSGKVTITVDRV